MNSLGQSSKPLITIILPVYNAEKYLDACLTSLVKQTYDNIEILCLNDGSSDNSIDILKEFEKSYTRVKVLDLPNSGVAAVRNLGIEKAAGEYIMFSDADDWWELNACELAMSAMLKYDVDIVMFSYYREYANKTLYRDIFNEDVLVFDEEKSRCLWKSLFGLDDEELRNPELFDANNVLWSKLYKASIFKEHIEVRYPDNRVIGAGGDGLLNVYYFKYVKKAAYISDHLYHYRKTNEHSIVSSYKPNFFEKRNLLFDKYQQVIDENHLEEDFSKRLSNRRVLSIIGLGLHELTAPVTRVQKIRNIKFMLCDARYHQASQSLNLRHMPMHWKLFFILCRYKQAIGVYALLNCIKLLKKKI